EYTALPDATRIVEAVQRAVNGTLPRTLLVPPRESAPVTTSDFTTSAGPSARHAQAVAIKSAPTMSGPVDVVIKVPIMGEGIRAARVVSLLKKAGEPVGLDEALCEVETDKAVYPIESSMVGV